MSDMYSFDDDNGEETQDRKDSNPVKQLREALKAREKELKDLKKEAEELRTFRTEYEQREKVSTSAKAFEKFGLTQKHAELYLKVNPEAEVTDQTIQEFAQEYALPLQAPAENEEMGAPPAPREAPFVPADVGSTADSGFVSREQLDAMYKVNPQRAMQVLKSGRVRWNNSDEN